MISLPHHLPFVRVGSNSLTICQQEWLDQTLTDAVDGTDVPEWLAMDISKGVKNYLEKQYHGSVIDSEELFNKIGTTLTSIGLEEVAANLDKSPPPLRISLTDLARRAGEAYELAFFSTARGQVPGSDRKRCLLRGVPRTADLCPYAAEQPAMVDQLGGNSARRSSHGSMNSGFRENWPTRSSTCRSPSRSTSPVGSE